MSTRHLSALSFTIVLAFACKDLQPLSPAAELNLCRAEAIAPLVGSVDAAVQIVRDVNAGRVSLAEVVSQAKATQAQVMALVVALEKCDPTPVPEGVEASASEESL
jgi:hypothetical protein